MVHFLRNRLYKHTICKIEKNTVETATTHTLVTCSDCLDRLIEWKEKELVEIKELRSKARPPKIRKRVKHKQTEIDFESTSIDRGETTDSSIHESPSRDSENT